MKTEKFFSEVTNETLYQEFEYTNPIYVQTIGGEAAFEPGTTVNIYANDVLVYTTYGSSYMFIDDNFAANSTVKIEIINSLTESRYLGGWLRVQEYV